MRLPLSTSRPPSRGFTLVELAVVMLIIGLLVTFILTASYEGVQRAQVRATQGLISKLDAGFSLLHEVYLSQRVEPNGAHRYLAAILPPMPTPPPNPLPPYLAWGLPSDQRAQVIARYDYLKAQLPDVFFFYPYNPASQPASPFYPINFAAQPYFNPLRPSPVPQDDYVLPLGTTTYPAYVPNSYDTANPPNPIWLGPGDSQFGQGVAFNGAGIGIYGASYSAASGVYKNLGYLPQGYDGIDNNNNGYIDEMAEGVYQADGKTDVTVPDPDNERATITIRNLVSRRMLNHTHKTARAEMLYALLVEGPNAPYSRDDFKASEVADTDNDGLPEFVDSWGEPIRFYRWPVHYIQPGVQKGVEPYDNSAEPRQRSAIDENNQLVSYSWWWSAVNAGRTQDPVSAPSGSTTSNMSSHAFAFQWYFHPIVEYDPTLQKSTPPTVQCWDVSTATVRRAYFTKHLITSSGPDRKLGIGQLGFNYTAEYGTTNGTAAPVNALTLLQIEGPGGQLAPYRDVTDQPFYRPGSADTAAAGEIQLGLTGSAPMNAPAPNTSFQTQDQGWINDDITNLDLPNAAGGIQ